MKGIVFDVQHYAMYDGPGIRTCVFLKGCALRCQWCHNPESQNSQPEISYFAERCTACGQCVEACPENALRMADEGILRERQKCTVCGTCASICPTEATEIIGKEMSSDDILQKVAGDKVFYESSGGGVTISGGEPTMQAAFLLETLQCLRQEGIHTALETCGYFSQTMVADLTGLVDLFLYDIKHADSDIHKKFTGVSNDGILSNFSIILSRVGNERIVPRIPVIPAFNDQPEAVDGIIRYLKETGYSGPVHLMPYNRLAKTKWQTIGKGSSYKEMGTLSDEDLESIASRFEHASFPSVCNA